MPLFSYRCEDGHLTEELFFHGEEIKETIACECCGADSVKLMPLTANMNAMWQETCLQHNDYFSPSLGRNVSGRREEEKIMKAKGYVPESALPQHFWEDEGRRRIAKAEEQNKYIDKYTAKLAEGKSKEEAVNETFTVDKCLDGTLDKVFSKADGE